MNIARLALGAVTVGVVLGITMWEANERVGPGPLHPSHENVAELRDPAGCAECHSDDEHDLASACAECHATVGEQIDRRLGLHGAVPADQARRCGDCHAEHRGAEFALVAEHSFRLVGIDATDSYDHRHVAAFELTGAHAQLQCDACHVRANADHLEAGQRRFLGLQQACATCHEDPHKGAFGGDCAECHGQDVAFERAPHLQHDMFALEAAHLGVACLTCHEPDSAHAVEALQADRPETSRACATCHADPHSDPAPGRSRFDESRECSTCHDTDAFAKPLVTTEDHRRFGCELRGRHHEAGCASCHADHLASDELRIDDCSACHESPHRQSFLTGVTTAMNGASIAATCVECHAEEHESFGGPSAQVAPELHAATGFVLEVPHAELDCVQCHPLFGQSVREDGEALAARFARRYPERSAEDCAACHEDVHDRQFDQGPTRGRCLDCHDKHRFEPSRFDVTAHERTFPLNGAHGAVPCVACHPIPAGSDEPRVFAGTARECARCHEDPHDGRFDRRDQLATIDGRSGCARCHGADSFRTIVGRFDHGAWTGHELVGAHRKAACTACHERAEHADTHGRTFGRAPTRCADCHADPHAGQFRTVDAPGVSRRADCARCHREDRTFAKLVFDHQRDARFALDESHRQLACSACHKPVTAPDGTKVVRYRPLGIECTDCHGGKTPRAGSVRRR